MIKRVYYKASLLLLVCFAGIHENARAQSPENNDFKQASGRVEKALESNKKDTLAQGYFDLAVFYYQKGDIRKSEAFYKKSKELFEKLGDVAGIAKSSRALAKVQEGLNKDKEAIENYKTASDYNIKNNDISTNTLNVNDINRLSKPESSLVQSKLLRQNFDINKKVKDTAEMISYYVTAASANYSTTTAGTADALNGAYQLAKKNPEQAVQINQWATDAYLKDQNFTKAIETKKQILSEGFVQSSTQLKASEINSLAQIYLQKNESNTAVELLNEAYTISVKNGHTLEARKCVEQLDSIYQSGGQKEKSLRLYQDFLTQLPAVIDKDSSFLDNKLIAETEKRLQVLEKERKLKDDLIRRKNVQNYWLIGSICILVFFVAIILYVIKKLRIKNKKIALQSLRREMNPHFIFNSLNSVNQFIASNNEMEANRYLTRFSTLMRNVMENSKEDFVLLSKEIELLKNYLELERTRFPDKFSYHIHVDDTLYANEHLRIPGMLIQPHIENAVWHGLRYIEDKGVLNLSFIKKGNGIDILVEDNGIGIAASKSVKTSNQLKHTGRGITNIEERIKILNELYQQQISCSIVDKAAPDHGVKVTISIPTLKNINSEPV